MTDAPAEAASSSPGPTSTPATRPRRRGWRGQLGLRGLILLVVVAALGFSIAADRRQIDDLTRRVDRMQAMVGELDVADPTQPAAMMTNEQWIESVSWDVYLPPGHQYRLALATRGIDDDGFPRSRKTAPLPPGRYRLTATQDRQKPKRRLFVRKGNTPILEGEESPTWGGGIGQTIGAWMVIPGDVGKTIQRPVGQPLPLYRLRFASPVPGLNGPMHTPDGPTDGVLLWIESQPATAID